MREEFNVITIFPQSDNASCSYEVNTRNSTLLQFCYNQVSLSSACLTC